MAHSVTYELSGERHTIETEDALDSFRVARVALSHGAHECIINDDGFHCRLSAWNELSDA